MPTSKFVFFNFHRRNPRLLPAPRTALPSRLAGLALLGCALALLAGAGAGGGEAAGRPIVPGVLNDGLPETLVEFPGGALSRAKFRAAVGTNLRDSRWPFNLREEFLYQSALVLTAAELGLPATPDEALLDSHLARVEQDAGGAENFRRALAAYGRTLHDYRRIDLPAGLLALGIARNTTGLAPQAALPDNFVPDFLEEQKARRRPVWRGWDAPLRVITLDGRDYTDDELLSFTIVFAPDALLRGVFDRALELELLAAAMTARGVGTVDGLFPEELSEESLRARHTAALDALALAAVSWIYLPFPAEGSNAAPTIPGVDPAEAAHEAVWAEAVRLRARLSRPDADFAELARKHSAAAADRGGFLGYLAGEEWVARFVPPAAYQLDALPDGQSPLAIAPDPAIRAVALALGDGEISQPLRLAGGYALVRRGATRAAPPWERMRGPIAAWRRHEAVAAFTREALADCRFHWTPEKR